MLRKFRTSILALACAAGAAQGFPHVISRTPSGALGNGASAPTAMSGDGRFVYFESVATDLVPGTSGVVSGIYVRDTVAGTTVLLSRDAAGAPLGFARTAVASADGRHVAYRIGRDDALGFDAGLAKPSWGMVALLDRDADADGVLDEAGATSTRIIDDSGLAGSASALLDTVMWPVVLPLYLSADGRFVSYLAKNLDPLDADHYTHGYIRLLDRDTDADGVFDEPGATQVHAVASHNAFDRHVLTRDGSAVFFDSSDHTIVAGEPDDGNTDVYRYDVATGVHTVMPLSPTLHADKTFWFIVAASADGGRLLLDAWVKQGSSSPGPTHAYLFDVEDQVLQRLNLKTDGSPSDPGGVLWAGQGAGLSADGRFALFATISEDIDLDGIPGGNLYVYDDQLGGAQVLQLRRPGAMQRRHSTGPRFNSYGPWPISEDGRYVALWADHFLPPHTGAVGAPRQAGRWDRADADLAIQVGDAGLAAADGILTYPVTVTNQGASTARAAWVRGYTTFAASFLGGAFPAGACVIERDVASDWIAGVRCPVGDLAPGQSRSGTAQVDSAAVGTDLQLYMSAESENADRETSDDADGGIGAVAADLVTVVTMTTKRKERREKLAVNFTVTNASPSLASAAGTVELDTSLAASLVTASIGGVTCPGYLLVESRCALPALAPGGSVSGKFVIRPQVAGQLTATITAASPTAEYAPATNVGTRTKRIYR